MRTRLIRGSVLLALLFTAMTLAAEDPNPPPDKAKPEAQGQDLRKDPTTLSAGLKRALRVEPPEAKPVVVVEKATTPKIPDVAVKAFVQTAGKPATAILEIDGKRQYTVREGMHFGIKGSDDRTLMIVVTRVSAEGVEIEFPELKQKISPR